MKHLYMGDNLNYKDESQLHQKLLKKNSESNLSDIKKLWADDEDYEEIGRMIILSIWRTRHSREHMPNFNF